MTHLMMALSEPQANNSNILAANPGLDLQAENDRMRAQISRLRTYVTELEHTADTDPLVPIYNRRAFIRELARAQSVAERYDIASSVIYLDLNGFKAVNDEYGHLVGDDILCRVALAIKSGIRACDMVARLGGDEFGILLFKSSGAHAATKAEALGCRIVDVKVRTGGVDVGVTASWGVAECAAGVSPSEVLIQADQNMYRKKREIAAQKS